MGKARRSWVWYSDECSRNSDKISILAVLETIVAVGFYWWLAYRIDTAIFLVFSPVIAFFLLLRSPQSVAEGVRLFMASLRLEKTSFSIRLTAAFAIFVATGGISYLLVNQYLIGGSGWPLFWRTLSLAIFVVIIFVTLVTLIAGRSMGIAASVIAALVLLISAAFATVLVLNSEMTTVSNVALVVIVVMIFLIAFPEEVIGFIFRPGLFLGIFFRAMLIRFWSTTRFFLFGVNHFYENWHRVTWQQDFRTPPELIPDLPVGSEFEFSAVMKRVDSISIGSINNIYETPLEQLRFGGSIVAGGAIANWLEPLILYLPSFLYRMTLKSTAWLYLPLVLVIFIPVKLRDERKKEVWVKAAGRSWFTLISAVGVLVYALVIAFDPDAFAELKAANENQMLTLAHLIWILDPRDWKLWFIVTVPSAFLTIVVWFWINRIRVDLESGGSLIWYNTQIRWLIAVNQAKNVLLVVWMSMTLLSVARAGWLMGKLPDSIEPLFIRVILPITSIWSS